ncbi:hypothetical protein MSPP1_003202 [Malassezia sp. CBS 17886]|nr:hypothetical protein MSPP1_003202 [Malassezia sp. CBS 17886]
MIKASVITAAAIFALGVCWPAGAERAETTVPAYGTAVHTAPHAFPTSQFPSMYLAPTGEEAEPRPVITRVSGGAYPDTLAAPLHLPSAAPKSEGVLPLPSAAAASQVHNVETYKAAVLKNLTALINDTTRSTCDRCTGALRIGQTAARAAPAVVPDVMSALCRQFQYGKNPTVDTYCDRAFGTQQLGGPYTQVLSYGNFSAGSPTPQYICARLIHGSACEPPAMHVFSDEFLHAWFDGVPEVPAEVASRSKRVGARADRPLRVFHGSDFHVDGRYMVGAEGNCDSYPCCRADSYNKTLWHAPSFPLGALPAANTSAPASYWGHYQCDAPWALVAAGMQGIAALHAEAPLDFAVYTGDLTTHDAEWHISQDLVRYSEQALFDMFHTALGNATMVVALGNHDSAPSDFAPVANLPDGRGDQLSWEYENVAALVKANGWGDDAAADAIRTHYGGYAVSPRAGLRVVSLNTDFWYKSNPMAYVDVGDPDVSGMLRWFTNELADAEQKNERVWVVGHVLSGWDGSNGLDEPTALFYAIVVRYHNTIAHIFFGHTHEDQFQLFYQYRNGNTSDISGRTPDVRAHAFIGPSLTPLTNVNPSLRVYEVDPETYDVVDYLQYYTPIDDFHTLGKAGHGPVWRLLYRARETYQNLSASLAAGTYAAGVPLEQNGTWPAAAPLNASFWAAVTDEMEARPALIELHQALQGRRSPRSPPCSDDRCYKAKVCYMRSGSSNLGRSCPSGYASVQNA